MLGVSLNLGQFFGNGVQLLSACRVFLKSVKGLCHNLVHIVVTVGGQPAYEVYVLASRPLAFYNGLYKCRVLRLGE